MKRLRKQLQKKFFRGKRFKRTEFERWVKKQKIDEQVKEKMLSLKVDEYTGYAEGIVKVGVKGLRRRMRKLEKEPGIKE